MREIFRSNVRALTVHPSGWVRMPSGIWVTKLPIWDSEAGLFARCSPHAATVYLESLGVRLATIATYDEIHRTGFHIEPFVLPTPAMIRGAGIVLHGSDDAAKRQYMAEVQAFRVANMQGRAWCEMHDAEVFHRLEAWDQRSPVDNAGKHWAEPPAHTLRGMPWPAGFGCIFGWWTPHASSYGVHPGATMIQDIGSEHEAGRADDNSDGYPGDYATTFHAESDDPTQLAIWQGSIVPASVAP